MSEGFRPTTYQEGLRITMFSRRKETARAIESLQSEVASLRETLDSHADAAAGDRDTARNVAERLSALEARVSGMGTELSRQLHELGDEIERLARDVADPAVRESVEALRSVQVQLAAEQARYEIAFRKDLAELADRLLNRPPT